MLTITAQVKLIKVHTTVTVVCQCEYAFLAVLCIIA